MSLPLHRMSGAELERAASSGSVAALEALSVIVEHGWRGFAPDTDRAIELERQAAAAGSGRAARWLGDRNYRGDGVTQDRAEAMTWYRRAASLGDVDAMANLIPLMKSENPDEASEGRKWLALAAAAGQPYAVNTLRHQDVQVAEMTLAQFAKLSLAEIAALAEQTTEDMDLHITNDLSISLEQTNDLVGTWIERLRARWPDLITSAEASGDELDFPGPDVDDVLAQVAEQEDTIELTIKAGVRHLQVDIALADDGCSLQATSFEPHPTRDEQRWLADELQAAGEALGIEIEVELAVAD